MYLKIIVCEKRHFFLKQPGTEDAVVWVHMSRRKQLIAFAWLVCVICCLFNMRKLATGWEVVKTNATFME